MLTDKDIDRITNVVATKDDLNSVLNSMVKNEDFAEFKSEIFPILDGITKSVEELKMEYQSIKVQLDRREPLIRQIAEKSGVVLID